MPRHRDQPLLDEIGARIARLRRDRRMSQEALAAKIGITAESISRAETGVTGLSLGNLVRTAEALGVVVGDLVDRARPLPAAPEGGDAEELVRLFQAMDAPGQGVALRQLRELSGAWPGRSGETGD